MDDKFRTESTGTQSLPTSYEVQYNLHSILYPEPSPIHQIAHTYA